jgi:hypothetical protein
LFLFSEFLNNDLVQSFSIPKQVIEEIDPFQNDIILYYLSNSNKNLIINFEIIKFSNILL